MQGVGGYVEPNYSQQNYTDENVGVGDYSLDGYCASGYTKGDDTSTPPIPTATINTSNAIKFFVKKDSLQTKDSIVTSVESKLGELSKDIAIVSDLRDGSQYVVINPSKQAVLSLGERSVDVVGGVSVEIIQA